MEFPVQTANPAKAEAACLVVPVFKDGDLLPAAAKLDDASERLIAATSMPSWATCNCSPSPPASAPTA